MSDLTEFLAANVEGYLFEDLSTMCAAAPASIGCAGAVGYPLVLSTFSGIELLGALLSPATFAPHGKGHQYFNDYWQNHLYLNDKNRQLAGPTLYQLIRHGLAHSFVTKGRISIVKHNPTWHLVRDSNGIVYVDAVELANDLIASYRTGIKSWIASGSQASKVLSMEARFQEVRQAYTAQASKLVSVSLAPAPAPPAVVVGPLTQSMGAAPPPAPQFGPSGATSKGTI